MRKVICFFPLAILLMISGTAFSQGASLTVMSDKGEKFTLEVNGSIKNASPADRVSATNLMGPMIKVKLILEDAKVSPVSKAIFNKPNGDFYYVLRKNPNGVYVLESVTSTYTPSVTSAAAGSVKEEKEEKTAVKETKAADASATKEKGCLEPVSDEEFAPLFASVSARPFEGIKASAIKKLVVDKCLTTTQVKELLYILDMEPSRLDVAKYAYVHVYDPANYGDIDEVFHAKSSVESLHNYINSKK